MSIPYLETEESNQLMVPIEENPLGPVEIVSIWHNIYRIKITKDINDKFFSKDLISNLSNPILVHIYTLLYKNIERCFGISGFNAYADYNFDERVRLGLEPYIYLTYDSDRNDVVISALFLMSKYGCEIWSVCKNADYQVKVSQEFLMYSLQDASNTFGKTVFWISIDVEKNSRVVVEKLFELYNGIGFHEPLLTNKTLNDRDAGMPMIELILNTRYGETDKEYTVQILKFYLDLYYNKTVSFERFDFSSCILLPNTSKVSVSIYKELIPSHQVDIENLASVLKKLTTRKGSEGATAGESAPRYSNLHRLQHIFINEANVEIAGSLQGSTGSTNKIFSINAIENLSSSTERGAVHTFNLTSMYSFHTHPRLIVKEENMAVSWPSHFDFDTAMFAIDTACHFVFSDEGLYLLKNNYLFKSSIDNLKSLLSQTQLEGFILACRGIARLIVLHLESKRSRENILPRGMISKTVFNTIRTINSITLLDTMGGAETANFKLDDIERNNIATITNEIMAGREGTLFHGLREWVRDFANMFYNTNFMVRKTLRTPMFALGLIPTSMFGENETQSVLIYTGCK